jgi:hypothetical protein
MNQKWDKACPLIPPNCLGSKNPDGYTIGPLAVLGKCDLEGAPFLCVNTGKTNNLEWYLYTGWIVAPSLFHSVPPNGKVWPQIESSIQLFIQPKNITKHL